MSQRNTFVLAGAVVCALLLLGIGVFYFLFGRSDTQQYNFNGSIQPEKLQASVVVTDTARPKYITAFTPRINERVGSPITISGELAAPYTTLHYRLTDTSGTVLAEDFIETTRVDGQTRGLFQGDLSYTASSGGKGSLELFVVAPDSAEELFPVNIPIFYTETREYPEE